MACGLTWLSQSQLVFIFNPVQPLASPYTWCLGEKGEKEKEAKQVLGVKSGALFTFFIFWVFLIEFIFY